MTKELKILSILFFSVFLLAIYISFESRLVPVTEQETQNQKTEKKVIEKPKEKVDMAVLNNEYKEKTKTFLTNYEKLVSDKDNLTEISSKINEVNKLEEDLMGLTVPEEYKNLHFSFILALNKIENYADTGDQNVVNDGFNMIENMKNQYSWLN